MPLEFRCSHLIGTLDINPIYITYMFFEWLTVEQSLQIEAKAIRDYRSNTTLTTSTLCRPYPLANMYLYYKTFEYFDNLINEILIQMNDCKLSLIVKIF